MPILNLDERLAALLAGDKALDETVHELLTFDLYRRRKISSGKARELLGIDYMDFVRRAAELDMPIELTTEEDLERDLAALDAWRKPR